MRAGPSVTEYPGAKQTACEQFVLCYVIRFKEVVCDENETYEICNELKSLGARRTDDGWVFPSWLDREDALELIEDRYGFGFCEPGDYYTVN